MGKGNFGRDGPSTNKRLRGISLRDHKSEGIDPSMKITKISHRIFLDEGEVFGYYDINGLPKKGELVIYTERKGKKKLEFVILESDRISIEDYILHQNNSCDKRGYGFVYKKIITPKYKVFS